MITKLFDRLRSALPAALLALVVLFPAGAFAVGPTPYVVTSIAAMQALGSPGQYPYVQTIGYNAGTTVGGGLYVWNSSSVAATDYCTIFAVTGVGTGRYTLVSSGAPLNVQQCGAYGDGSHNDTTALKNAIAAEILNGQSLFLPCGTYNINAVLPITTSYGWDIGGQSPNCAIISQQTNATAIFQITGANVWGWKIHDLQGSWLNKQTSGVDSSHLSDIVEVTSGAAVYNFQISRVWGVNGSRMMTLDSGGVLWGATFANNYRDKTMTGSVVSISPASPGEPRITIRDNFSQIDGAVQTESMFVLYDVGQLIMENNEIDGVGTLTTPFNTSTIHLIDLSQTSGTIDGFNVEAIWTKSGGSLINVQGSNTVGSFHVALKHIIMADNVTDSSKLDGVYMYSANAGSPPAMVVSIDGLTTAAYAGSSSNIWPWDAQAFVELQSISGIITTTNNAFWTSEGHFNPVIASGGSYVGGFPLIDNDIKAPDCSQSVGNVNVTLTLRSNNFEGGTGCKYIYLTTHLTANRTITLPLIDTFDDGTEFVFIRNEPATISAFSWIISDPNSGTTCTFPASTNGTVTAHAPSYAQFFFKDKVGCS